LASITHLYYQIYSTHPKKDELFEQLIATLVRAYQSREKDLRKRDEEKAKKGHWFLSNELVGMSLYVDRFAGNLPQA
jgi:amylosucrase